MVEVDLFILFAELSKAQIDIFSSMIMKDSIVE